MPIKMLTHCVNNNYLPDHVDRTELYRFDTVFEQFDQWQSFHRAWPDFAHYELFIKLNKLFENRFDTVIYPIHPFEFDQCIDQIATLQNTEFYYVDLDLTMYGDWVAQSKEKLNFYVRPKEIDYFKHYIKTYNMTRINLTDMLDGNCFMDEYIKTCRLMQLPPDLAQASQLYQGWLAVRGPNSTSSANSTRHPKCS